MNDFNKFDNYNEEDVVFTEATTDKVIPAVVKPKKNGGKGKVVLLTAAVALASFGAGSLYTSYNWIQDKEVALSKSQTNTVQTPNANVNQTGATHTAVNMSVSEIASAASNSVVEITTESVQNDMFMRQYVSEGAGSGVIISSDGYIVTNNHVINGATKITVRLKDGTEYEGKLIGTDSQTDLAVIKVDAKDLSAVTYGDSDQLVVGDTAVAIGNPLGELGGTVTNGIISATGRQISLENQTMTLLQTNAAINPGNSGGGLFNDQGQLIGIVVAKSSGSNVEGLGFAIPVNVVKEVVQSIIDVGYVQGRPVLGISIVDVNSEQLMNYYGVPRQGVYILQLTEGTKAEKSGLKVGDCIIAVEDTQISSASDLTSVLKEYKVGDTVKVMVSRDGKLMTVNVELSESVPTTQEAAQTETNESNNFSDFFGNNSAQSENYFPFSGR